MDERTYRLNPPDKTGFVLGLSLAQLGVGGFGVMLAVSLFARRHLILGPVVLMVTVVVAFGRNRGEPILELVPHALRWARQGARKDAAWFAPLPLLVDGAARPIPLPPVLAGQRIVPVEGARYGFATQPVIAVVHDEPLGLVSVTVRAHGRRFGLFNDNERVRAVDAWGEVLVGWARERTAVDQLRWTEWAAPAGLELHRSWLEDHSANEPVPGATETYEQLLTDAGVMVTPHDVLITLVINGTKAALDNKREDDRLRVATDTLMTETRSLLARLEAAGISASLPLSPGELGRVLRGRFDPWCVPLEDRRSRTLGERFGISPPELAGPLACKSGWTTWRTDSVIHRAFVVAEWPRRNLHPEWLSHLLLEGRLLVRAVTMLYEPIAPSRSRRAITFTDTKLEPDEHQRRTRGFRVPAALQRQKEAVRQREHELEDGHGEFAYAGILVVSARDEDELRDACREIEELASQAAMTLRPLDGRHDRAMAATLPLARSVASRPAWKDVTG